ncbi:MAG: N-acetylneuraminate synthase [Candidatus Omnitrophica bacterium]|nr:N-acetylneuraminate synthase [Candidatus Omnitrophota bacterium]
MVDRLWDRIVNPNSVFVIAEAGVNHNGDINLAKQLVDMAIVSGADAVKFQTFSAERLVIPSAPKADYQTQTDPNSKSQLEMLEKLQLSEDDYRILYQYCKDKGIIFLSTPFDKESANFLEGLGLEVFKIPSGEITNIPLLTHIATKQKPMIISTGMSTLDEVEEAVRAVNDTGNNNIVLLHCVSSYPAKSEDVNLKAMQTMSQKLNVPIGYSDHTLGSDVALAAVAMSAVVIEKHFTLDRNLSGPDQKSSLEPAEFKDLVERIHKIKLALGDGDKKPASSEANVASVARKSLVAGCHIKAGTMLSEGLITIKRPGTGLAPSMASSLVGRKAKVDIPKDELLSLDMLV